MNAERPKSGQIFHCKHSFFKAPSNPTGHEAHTCPAEHRAPRSGGKHKASQPVSTLQLLLCLWASLCLSKIRCKSGQPGCSPGTISVGGTTALELNTSCKSSWATWVTEQGTDITVSQTSNLSFVLFRKTALNTLGQGFAVLYLKKHEQPRCPSRNPVVGVEGPGHAPWAIMLCAVACAVSHCHLSRTTVLLAAELSSFLQSCSKKGLKH